MIENNMKIQLIGVPTNSTGKKDGVAKAPDALRKAGLVDMLAQHCDVYDVGNVEFLDPKPQRKNGILAYDSFVSMIYSVRKNVIAALEKKHFPLVMGGDCPILLGCLAASRDVYDNYGLFFIDGHEDTYPPHISPTGEAADMELGFALGKNIEDLTSAFTYLLPLIERKSLCLLGPRDRKIIQNYGIKSLMKPTMDYDDISIKYQNVDELISKAIAKMHTMVNRWWLHVDFDVLDSNSMPAVDYPQPGGLDWTTLEHMTIPLLSSACGMNITIYNPDLDPTAKCAKQIIKYLERTISFIPLFGNDFYNSFK